MGYFIILNITKRDVKRDFSVFIVIALNVTDRHTTVMPKGHESCSFLFGRNGPKYSIAGCEKTHNKRARGGGGGVRRPWNYVHFMLLTNKMETRKWKHGTIAV